MTNNNDNDSRALISQKILRLLDAHIVCDGNAHPAEAEIAQFYNTDPPACLSFFLQEINACLQKQNEMGARDLLILAGRALPKGDAAGDWKKTVVRSALKRPETHLRCAAVDACEQWAWDALAGILGEHEEPVGWLKEYQMQVMVDLQGN